MPGPAGFLDEVVQATEEGLNVAIALPAQGAGGLLSALLDRLRQRIVDGVAVAGAKDPAAQVASALGIAGPVHSAEQLYAEEGFLGCQTVCLQSLTTETWGGWRSFLAECDDLSKDRAVGQRPAMIAILEGMDLPPEITDGVTFRGFRWFGRVSTLDMTQYVHDRLEYAPESEGGRLLAASIVARVALGDVELAEELARRPLAEIWEPTPLLKEWGGRLGWIKGSYRHWTVGTVFRVDGRDEQHSALVALDDTAHVIDSRVWAAQAAMLLPAIERERAKLVSRARNYLKPPFDLLDGESVADARELEIGPLEYHLRRGRAPQELCRRARELKELRNKLAHMEPLTVEEALFRGLC